MRLPLSSGRRMMSIVSLAVPCTWRKPRPFRERCLATHALIVDDFALERFHHATDVISGSQRGDAPRHARGNPEGHFQPSSCNPALSETVEALRRVAKQPTASRSQGSIRRQAGTIPQDKTVRADKRRAKESALNQRRVMFRREADPHPRAVRPLLLQEAPMRISVCPAKHGRSRLCLWHGQRLGCSSLGSAPSPAHAAAKCVGYLCVTYA